MKMRGEGFSNFFNRLGLTTNVRFNVFAGKLLSNSPGSNRGKIIKTGSRRIGVDGKLYYDSVEYKKSHLTFRGALALADILASGALLGLMHYL